jgi:hypothetical protein
MRGGLWQQRQRASNHEVAQLLPEAGDYAILKPRPIEVEAKEMLKLKDEEVLYILEVQLPDMLERNPELEPRAFRAFLKAFVSKEEFAAVLSELRELRGEVRHFRQETQERFEQIDRRFEEIDRRFEQIDKRFEQIDRRFEEIDRRFEQIDKRFEQIDRRFEEIDRRFEGIDRRFEGIDRRFEGIDQQFAALRQMIADEHDWVELTVGGLQRRSGRKLEEVVAGALRVALRRSDIKPEQIRLRQRIVDEKGVVGLPGQRHFEIDILAQDGKISVFEVKSYCEWEDVDRLADKVTLVRSLNPGVEVEGIMIAMSIGDEVRERCRELGITLVYHGE